MFSKGGRNRKQLTSTVFTPLATLAHSPKHNNPATPIFLLNRIFVRCTNTAGKIANHTSVKVFSIPIK